MHLRPAPLIDLLQAGKQPESKYCPWCRLMAADIVSSHCLPNQQARDEIYSAASLYWPPVSSVPEPLQLHLVLIENP